MITLQLDPKWKALRLFLENNIYAKLTKLNFGKIFQKLEKVKNVQTEL